MVVLTSNLGSENIRETLVEADTAAMQALVMEEVGRYFRPEFINRIDETIVFHSLEPEHIYEIAKLQLTALKSRLKERDLELELNTDVLDYLAENECDLVYGARPLKRAIQRLIENPLAEAILDGRYNAGDTIEAAMSQDNVIFQRAKSISQVA